MIHELHIERVVLADGALVEGSIGGPLYQGARVPVDDLMREDRLYLGRCLAKAVVAWVGALPAGPVVLTCEDGTLALVLDERLAPPFAGLAGDARCVIEAALADFVELVQGSVVIAPGGQAVGKRRGGDAPT